MNCLGRCQVLKFQESLMPRSNSVGVLEGLSLRHLHLIPDYVRLVEPMPVAAHRVRDLFETWCLSPSSMSDVMLSLGSLLLVSWLVSLEMRSMLAVEAPIPFFVLV